MPPKRPLTVFYPRFTSTGPYSSPQSADLSSELVVEAADSRLIQLWADRTKITSGIGYRGHAQPALVSRQRCQVRIRYE